jgi:hypothetical protein
MRALNGEPLLQLLCHKFSANGDILFGSSRLPMLCSYQAYQGLSSITSDEPSLVILGKDKTIKI